MNKINIRSTKNVSREYFFYRLAHGKIKELREEIILWSSNLEEFCIAYSLVGDSLAHYHMKNEKSDHQKIQLKF